MDDDTLPILVALWFIVLAVFVVALVYGIDHITGAAR